jgi:hypothetical protein
MSDDAKKRPPGWTEAMVKLWFEENPGKSLLWDDNPKTQLKPGKARQALMDAKHATVPAETVPNAAPEPSAFDPEKFARAKANAMATVQAREEERAKFKLYDSTADLIAHIRENAQPEPSPVKAGPTVLTGGGSE